MMSEIFGGRGVWDAARFITVLLAAFSLASWGLELSVDLSELEGEADLLNRPPPIVLRSDNNGTATDSWQVMTRSEINPGYDGDWRNLEGFNIHETHANSRYYIVKDANVYIGDNKDDQYMNGHILVADWATSEKDSLGLFYDTKGATVDSLDCSGETLKRADVYRGDDKWGTALDCDRGPAPSGGASSPPAIILTSDETGEVHVVVEESSSYPSFLYSVWKAQSSSSSEMTYTFHLASTARLAEAVVTGIVDGETEGGGCFALLRLFSETREKYGEDLQRASPFGEHPTGDTVQLQDLETIESGVEINMNALLCLVWLLVLTAVGIAWSICLKSSIGLDVYDRDELLRAVSLQGKASTDPTQKHGGIRIYVRRQDAGNIMVFINDAEGDGGDQGRGWRQGGWRQGGWRQLFGRCGPRVVADNVPAPDADVETDWLNDGFGGAVVPMEGTVSLGNAWNDTIPGMCASPVRSNVPSVAPTPVSSARGRGRSPAVTATPLGSAQRQALFESP